MKLDLLSCDNSFLYRKWSGLTIGYILIIVAWHKHSITLWNKILSIHVISHNHTAVIVLTHHFLVDCMEMLVPFFVEDKENSIRLMFYILYTIWLNESPWPHTCGQIPWICLNGSAAGYTHVYIKTGKYSYA